jgi:hypothetical protein
MTLRQPEQLRQPEDLELDHEWLQLIQMEKAIEEKKNQLRGIDAQSRWDPDEDHETFWDNEESLTEQNEHLDDGDLEYINEILNSFSKPVYKHGNSRNPKLKSITPEDALARSLVSQMTPQEFNLKFNQKSTTRGSEENHGSYFSNIEEKGAIDLGDYFSDDEEDDTWDREDLKSESHYWSHTQFNYSEDNSLLSQPTLSKWDPVISGLETINEARFEDNCEAYHISGLSEKTILGFSTWQPFIPLEHAFLSCAVQSQLLDFLLQASSSQEPTLIQISPIATTTELTPPPMRQISPQGTSLSPPKGWPSHRPATRPFSSTWMNKATEIIWTQAPTKGVPSSKTSRRSQQQDWKPSKQTRTPYTHNWTRPSPESKTTRWPNWTRSLPNSSKT